MQLCDACATLMEQAIADDLEGVVLCSDCRDRLGVDEAPVEIGVDRRSVDELFESPAPLSIVGVEPVTDGYSLTLSDGRTLFLALSMLDPTAFAPR